VRALTVRQGWAWGLVYGPKRIENRSRRIAYRGPLAIHAGLSRASVDACRAAMPELPPTESLIFGAVIGILDIVDCVPIAEVSGDRFASGPWCWITANPRPIDPIYCRGSLGLFDVDLRAASRRTGSLATNDRSPADARS
jgi:hypothetical protein